ncbi:hypothetical protein ACI792_16285 [Blastococcus sp. SYSU DS0669]
MFRKKTRGEIISAEVQEGLAHLGAAVTEAGRAAAEQLAPRVEAAQRAVAPKVAAAAAVAAPAVASARDTLGPRVDAARDALGPRVDAAWDAFGPRMDAAREAAAPRVAASLAAAQLAANRAATDLGPRVEAAQKALREEVGPRLTATQAAALGYATPRVLAAREAVSPALESARGTLLAGVDSARSELEARRAELAASAAESTRKARKAAKKARKNAGKKRRDFEKAALATATTVKRRTGVEPEPRRWPWVLALLAAGTAAFVLLRRSKQESWTPAPAGDGPVPSYREDPVPSSPSSSDSGKTVSDAQFTAGDSAPSESDMGVRDAQLVEGDDAGSTTTHSGPPEPFTSGGGAQGEGPTAGPDDKQV